MAKKQEKNANMPEKKFMAGAVSASIWLNEGKSQQGEDVEFRTVSVQRAYKDKAGEWQHTATFRVNDLPKLALVCGKAYEYLTMKGADDE